MILDVAVYIIINKCSMIALIWSFQLYYTLGVETFLKSCL